MNACVICRSVAVLDDIALMGPSGRYVCLHCFQHYTTSFRPLPRRLRRQIEATLSAMDEATA